MLNRIPVAPIAEPFRMAARKASRLLLAFLVFSCTPGYENIAEPGTNPHLLKPGSYWQAEEGKQADTDNLAPPKYVPGQGKYVQAGKPEYFPEVSDSLPVTPARYVPLRSSPAYLHSVAQPKYQPARGKKIPSRWPEWMPAQPRQNKNSRLGLTCLDMEQGLNNSYIRCLLKDSRGWLWMGTWKGGISVWDGAGLMQFTTEEGLSDNVIRCLMESRDGQIWIGTGLGGLSVWNGEGFTHFTTVEGLSGDHVKALLEDRNGHIWIGAGKGLSVWDGAGFTYYTTEEGLSSNNVSCLAEDSDGRVWIGTGGGGINVWNGTSFIHYTDEEGLCSNAIRSLLATGDGKIWVGTQKNGACVWDGTGFAHYTSENGLSGNQVWSLAEDQAGAIYLGIVGSGLNVWDGKGFIHLSSEDGLSHDQVGSVLEIDNGIVGIGTNGGGLNIWNRNGPLHFTTDEGLGNNDVCSLLESSDGKIWIGTYGGGVSIWDGTGFRRFTTEEGLCGNAVFSLLESRDGKIWIGTYGGGLCSWDGVGFTHYTTEQGLSNNYIYSLLESQDGRIWAGTLAGGVSVWDGVGFTHYTTEQGLSNNRIWSLTEDQKGKIWIGAGNGSVSVWDGTSFTHYTAEQGLSINEVWSLMESRDGNIWVGSNGGGLNVWDGTGFTHYTAGEGLSSNNVWGLMQDSKGDIWVSTMKGLNWLRPTGKNGPIGLQTFQSSDGLKGIMIKPMLEDREGNLWLGATEGLTWLNLETIRQDTSSPTLTLDGLHTFFDYIDWRQTKADINNNKNPLTGEQKVSLSKIKFDSVEAFTNLPFQPSFPHNINQLAFSWQGVHWPAPHHLQFAYFLEGRDEFWSPAVKDNKATYQGLEAGTYTFKVKAVSRNGQWSKAAEYPFTIRPPWWHTGWAYSLYLILFIGLLFFVYRFMLHRQLAIADARRLRELDALKTRLYINITHDFRSPLTIILGMAEQVAQHPKEWFEEGMQAIQRNGQRLLSLVNQILDLRQLESGAMKLNKKQGDLVGYIKYIIEAFHSYADMKNIDLQFQAHQPELQMDYDPEKLLQIISNLLSNAIKFTPEEGTVKVFIEKAGGQAQIRVSDSGIGISEEKLPFIFDRFYQGAQGPSPGGTGIGLALTRELVRLLGGEISVQSKVGEGTEFILRLPVTQEAALIEEAIPTTLQKRTSGFLPAVKPERDTVPPSKTSNALPFVLVIEDNSDVVLYLRSCLQEEYRMEIAENGQLGIDKAFELIPDIIISDIMMPEKDGLEVTEILKNDTRTSHIPIILLTAKANLDSKLAGLEKGADAYVPKPFHPEELLIRMRKLLELRQGLREYYRSLAGRTPAEGPGPLGQAKETRENAFLNKIYAVIEQHITDYNLSVDRLCLEMAMSHSQLYRKLTALTGYSPNKFIRYIRLSKAKSLLVETDTPVNLIAYDTGFNDSDYFSRAFRKEFGMTPKEFRSQNQH